jgi:hypothetical protein
MSRGMQVNNFVRITAGRLDFRSTIWGLCWGMLFVMPTMVPVAWKVRQTTFVLADKYSAMSRKMTQVVVTEEVAW